MTETVKTPEQILENLKNMLTKECSDFHIEKQLTTPEVTIVFITYDYRNSTYCVIIVDKGIYGNLIYFSPNNTYGTAFDIFTALRFALTGHKYE